MTRHHLTAATLSLAALVACNFGGTKDSDGLTDDSGEPGIDGPTIQDIQRGEIAEDETVTLEGVVATSGLTTTGEGFFIQTAGGGEYSGIYVYLQGGNDGLFLAPGDRLNVTGRVTEYYEWTELSVSSPTAIEVTGTAEVTVDAVDPCATTDYEPWESGLISIGATEVTEGVNQYGEAALACGLILDDLIYRFDTEQGATYTDVIGNLGYSYSTWKLSPRSADDLLGYVPGEGPAAVAIADIQQGEVPEDTRVTLEEVVVTTPFTSGGEGFFVQDNGGGAWSGLYVYVYGGQGDLVFAPGDVVTIEGSTTEYYDWTELSVNGPEDIELVGSADVVVDAVDPCTVDDWEVWESCLISTGPIGALSGPNNYGEVSLECDLSTNDLFLEVQAESGGSWDDLIGVLEYSFEAYKLNPRSEDDQVGYEAGQGGGGEYTVTEIQQGVVSDGGEVTVVGAVVTSAPTAYGNAFFVADPAGGEWSGIYVYVGNSWPDDLPSVGDEVTIEGEYTEYYDLSEITNVSAVTITGTATVPTPPSLSEAPSDWEGYEGVEVTLTGIEITDDANEYGEYATSFGDLVVDDLFGAPAVSSGTTYASITGHIYYSYSVWRLEPDEASDIVE